MKKFPTLGATGPGDLTALRETIRFLQAVQHVGPALRARNEREQQDAASAVHRLLETVADIAFIAGGKGYYSGDSRADVQAFITWAQDFEQLRVVEPNGDETYNGEDYMTAVERFAEEKINARQ